MGLLAFVLFGLVVGLLARAVMPGKQSLGLVVTALLGMAGSFVGGLIASVIYSVIYEAPRAAQSARSRMFELHPAGIIGSIIGALLVMYLVGLGGRTRAVV